MGVLADLYLVRGVGVEYLAHFKAVCIRAHSSPASSWRYDVDFVGNCGGGVGVERGDSARTFGDFLALWGGAGFALGDFNQTVIKGALRGFAIGVSAALLCALAIDRSRFLTKGLLPIGNFIAAMPIIGIAPIMVNWFGFDWQSKAAVVVIMVFFPILVNTTQGLQASHAIHRDLMKTYGASYWQVLCAMRLPSALPFIFNGLKISATLALIGAIVAEYFGSPTRGMGFRISTGVGRLDMDLVWAEIFVAALVGTGFYGAVTLAERYFTFWHPSQRNR